MTNILKEISMGSHSREVIEQARQLPVLERIEVVDALLATIDEADAEIDRLWAAEAEERLTAYRRGEIEAVDMEEVLAKHRQT
jgi:putative addiction module component (TIGR02574 family)